MKEERVCENCGRWIDHGEVRYVMRLQLLAEPGSPELTIPELPDSETLRKEMEEQIRRMEGMSPDEVLEAQDQVHESYEFSLCPECRETIHRRMKHREGILGGDQ